MELESALGGYSIRHAPKILVSLDEDFLPDVDLGCGNLNYTVVIGEVLGNYDPGRLPVMKGVSNEWR